MFLVFTISANCNEIIPPTTNMQDIIINPKTLTSSIGRHPSSTNDIGHSDNVKPKVARNKPIPISINGMRYSVKDKYQ